ncbi:MAG: hypothetical protein COA79_01335 [Planctomycetota bacterium]|nr:MAG: hypothetical protein COA79_01335 [Planctomycetota bacterium]
MNYLISLKVVTVFILLGVLLGRTMANEKDVQTIKQRLLEDLLLTSKQKDKVNSLTKKAITYLKSLNKDGSWKDINYSVKVMASWPSARHMSRLNVMAKAYKTKGSSLFMSASLKKGILNALNTWYKKDPQNINYWWNAIGVPNSLGPILLLMEKDLTKEQMTKGIKILKRGYRDGVWYYHGPATGQNLVWLCGIHVYRGVLENSPIEINKPLKRIAKEIVFTTDEGIQSDSSFHQHGPILYAGGYGRPFAIDCARLIYLTHGTSFSFSEQKIKILSSYVLDGQQWMIRGPTFDYGAIGREIARCSVRNNGVSIAKASRYMSKIQSPRKAEFTSMTKRLEVGAYAVESSLIGNRHYYRSDFMVHRRKGYYFSIKMFSKRTRGTESGNGENNNGRYLADGCTYLLRSGKEYEGIFPVWNWRKIPGTTIEQTKKPPKEVNFGKGAEGRTNFVGGTSDGIYGVAAFILKRKSLLAKKAWFCFEDEIVCLGAGITGKTSNPLTTTVNQSLLKGKINTQDNNTKNGLRKTTGSAWVHHDDAGYFFPGKTNIKLESNTRTGSWKSINKTTSAGKVTEKVFSLSVEHGANVKNGQYAYIVIPNIKAQKMNDYVKKDNIEIIRNSSLIQAVRHKELNIIQAVFYSKGTLKIKNGSSITVNHSCIIMVKEMKAGKYIFVSKPNANKKSANISITIDGKEKTIKVPTSRSKLGAAIKKKW